MQFGEAESPAHINRRGRERKGLEAIFTSQNGGRRGEILAGIAGVIAGLFLSILAIFRADAPQTLGPLANMVYAALTLGALAVFLLIGGGGTIAFALSRRESNLSNSGSQLDGRSAVDPVGDSVGHDETRGMFGPGSKTGSVAFIQSLVLVALYSGFVQEFQSNRTMQMWVRSNLPVGQYVLNWEAVLIFSAALGLLMLQFLPGRFFSDYSGRL